MDGESGPSHPGSTDETPDLEGARGRVAASLPQALQITPHPKGREGPVAQGNRSSRVSRSRSHRFSSSVLMHLTIPDEIFAYAQQIKAIFKKEGWYFRAF